MGKKKSNKSIASLITYSKKSKTSNNYKNATIASIVALCGIGIAIGGYVSSRPKPGKFNDYNIEFSGSLNLSNKERDDLVNVIKDELNSHNGINQDLVAKLQTMTNSGIASIVRTGFDSFLVRIEARQPLFYLKADTARYLSASGQIYGNIHKKEDVANLILVDGILESNRKQYTFAKDHTLELSAEEQDRIKSLIELNNNLKDHQLKAHAIRYIPYRGYELKLENIDTKIVLGKADFSAQISRLLAILEKFSAKGKYAESIELDYKGKAFIKEKKL